MSRSIFLFWSLSVGESSLLVPSWTLLVADKSISGLLLPLLPFPVILTVRRSGVQLEWKQQLVADCFRSSPYPRCGLHTSLVYPESWFCRFLCGPLHLI
ncbi:hypothetical protein Mapa_014049 [Marchantia paleacea]|nr:hypothetical protein Mapa_014049 [Marchantia paleacea]